MAIMCRESSLTFNEKSHEKEMYDLLEQQLSDDYYVFHSMDILNTFDGMLEHEADFVIYHRKYGILVLECKAVREWKVENGTWLFKKGDEYKKFQHGGPYLQAKNNMRHLMSNISIRLGENTKQACKFSTAVWFWYQYAEQIQWDLLGPDASPEITITADMKEHIGENIERIIQMPVKIEGKYDNNGFIVDKNNLTDRQADRLLKGYFAVNFNVMYVRSHHQKEMMLKMTAEQSSLLNYLTEQRTAAISGRAGTGKTVIAMEKARRAAVQGGRVLFLVFNKKLRDKLWQEIQVEALDDVIEVNTVSKWAMELTGKPLKPENDLYEAAFFQLGEQLENKTFPYKHVVIDEGQDFAQPWIKDIVDEFCNEVYQEKTCIEDFYIFYDKKQLVQAREDDIPQTLWDADCKLTLYKNCRNTKQIAQTTDSLLQIASPGKDFRATQIADWAVTGEKPIVFMSSSPDETRKIVDEIIEKEKGIECDELQILTCVDYESSELYKWSTEEENEQYISSAGDRISFTTARKFKGLEADVVIVTDVKMDMCKKDLQENEGWEIRFLPYVASSRAKLRLYIISDFEQSYCNELLMDKGKTRQAQELKAKQDMTKYVLNAKFCREGLLN